jgi:biotin operon repressor
MKHNPLLVTLRMIELLTGAPQSAAALAAEFNLSPVGVKRHIGEARLLGAELVSVRAAGTWRYELRNPARVIERTRRWIELENSRDVREADNPAAGAA